jgi:hypothetical protein
MTGERYEELYKRSRQDIAKLSLKAQLQISLAYNRAAADIASSLRESIDKGYAIETILQQSQQLADIQSRCQQLAADVQQLVEESLRKTAALATTPDREYLTSVFVDLNALDAEVVGGIFGRINDAAVRNAVSRMFADGYTLSATVWDLSGEFEDAVKEIIATGIAQGRDPVKIIRDIQSYVADGKLALADRWGVLQRGTPEWRRRIKGRIDYRAQRLVRSELQATAQAIGVQAGLANPASTGEFEWVLGPGLAHCAECTENAARTYQAAEVPSYPHPNCGCQVRPVLRDRKEFLNDLKSWIGGTVTDENRYVDDWAQNYLYKA